MIIRFFIYGLMGWCMEIIWTGIISLKNRDYKLTSTSSLWMFFIYGSAIFLEPICDIMAPFPLILRGGVYTICIFSVEYLTGTLLKKVEICPWDYGGSKYSVQGVIRIDYAPAWFAAGLVFELAYRLMK